MSTKNKAIEMLKKCDSYAYIGDRSTMLYHTEKCPTLPLIEEKHLQGCGKTPEASGFFPCHRCLEGRAQKADARRVKIANRKQTKADVLKDEMTLLCYEYGLNIGFVGNTAFVTTIAGEWFFDTNARPINLHHKNAEKRYDRNGISNGHYHMQDLTFSSPAEVLGYIYRHEQATIKRLMTEETNLE